MIKLNSESTDMTVSTTQADVPVYAQETFELFAHESVQLERSASDIWPLVIDPNSWKQGMKLSHVDGEKNQEGQVFAALTAMDDAAPQFYVKNVEVIANRRRTIIIMSPVDGATMGYSSWVLNESYAITKVSYHVYLSIPVPRDTLDAMSAEQITAIKAEQLVEHKTRLTQTRPKGIGVNLTPIP